MFRIIEESDGRKIFQSSYQTIILKEGYNAIIRKTVRKNFKKYKIKRKSNIYQIFVREKDRKYVDKFNEELKDKLKDVNRKVYYDVYFYV